MLHGTYFHPTVFYFGKDTEKTVGEEVKKYSGNVLFHYGQGSIKRNGLYDTVKTSLENAGLEIYELGGVEPNPRTGLVYQGIEVCRSKDIKFILAVGGGSVIDSAKAISIGAPYDGDFYDFFKQTQKPASALKIGTVLTMPGSGSESSPGAVITDLGSKAKNVCDNPLLIPVFSILNPKLTKTISKFQTSCGIVDAMSHVFERYFTITEYVDCTDRICEGLILTLMKYAALVQNEPENYDIRAEIMWACKLAHDNTPGFGRKQDWACHKICHEISAIYDVSHGAVMGIVFLAWFKWVSKKNIAKLVQFSRRIFGIDIPSDAEAVIRMINQFEAFLQNIGMPISLHEIGVSDKYQFPEIAERSVRFMQSGTIGNYVRLSPDDIISLLETAY